MRSLIAWREVVVAMTLLDMKVREVMRMLERNGWRHVRTTGSHRQFQHSINPGTVTVAGKPGVDMPAGTLSSILKRAGLKKP